MSAWELYAWGAVGGAVAAILVYALPPLAQAALWGQVENMTPTRVLFIAVMILVLAAVAGVAPLIFEVTSRGQAITYGLAAQTILKGIIESGKQAIRPPGSTGLGA